MVDTSALRRVFSKMPSVQQSLRTLVLAATNVSADTAALARIHSPPGLQGLSLRIQPLFSLVLDLLKMPRRIPKILRLQSIVRTRQSFAI